MSSVFWEDFSGKFHFIQAIDLYDVFKLVKK